MLEIMFKQKQLSSVHDLTSCEIQEVIRLYQEEGFGCRPIGERFGRSKDKIRKVLTEAGIQLRASGTAYLKTNPDERFWTHVEKSQNCWNWKSRTSPFGHGMFSLAKNNAVFAHRYSWYLSNGEIPDGMQVLHKCDNPRCVNPNHLFLGTQADNVNDMVSKGRAKGGVLKGSDNPKAKLTEGQTEEIKDRYAQGENARSIYEEYKISKAHFYRIINGNAWS